MEWLYLVFSTSLHYFLLVQQHHAYLPRRHSSHRHIYSNVAALAGLITRSYHRLLVTSFRRLSWRVWHGVQRHNIVVIIKCQLSLPYNVMYNISIAVSISCLHSKLTVDLVKPLSVSIFGGGLHGQAWKPGWRRVHRKGVLGGGTQRKAPAPAARIALPRGLR